MPQRRLKPLPLQTFDRCRGQPLLPGQTPVTHDTSEQHCPVWFSLPRALAIVTQDFTQRPVERPVCACRGAVASATIRVGPRRCRALCAARLTDLTARPGCADRKVCRAPARFQECSENRDRASGPRRGQGQPRAVRPSRESGPPGTATTTPSPTRVVSPSSAPSAPASSRPTVVPAMHNLGSDTTTPAGSVARFAALSRARPRAASRPVRA